MSSAQTYTRDATKDADARRVPDGTSVTNGVGTMSGTKMSDAAHHLKDDVQELADSAVTMGQEKLGALQSAASGYLAKMDQRIIAKPVQSLAIAFAAGAVLSLFVGRR